MLFGEVGFFGPSNTPLENPGKRGNGGSLLRQRGRRSRAHGFFVARGCNNAIRRDGTQTTDLSARLADPLARTASSALCSLGCKSTTMPPAINWSQDLTNLRQEIANPLVPVHPDLPELATRHTPSDDQDAHEDQHRIMRCWHANASGLRAKVEGQLARETLLQWVPVMQDCLSLLSLPLSLQAGESLMFRQPQHRRTKLGQGARHGHSGHGEHVPRLTLVAATEAHSTVSKVHNLIAKVALCEAYLDLSWYQLAKPQIWLWLLLDEIEALTPSIASVMNGGRSEVRDGNSPLLHLGALLPVQLLFFLVRHLLDEPERFSEPIGCRCYSSGHGARPGFGGPCER